MPKNLEVCCVTHWLVLSRGGQNLIRIEWGCGTHTLSIQEKAITCRPFLQCGRQKRRRALRCEAIFAHPYFWRAVLIVKSASCGPEVTDWSSRACSCTPSCFDLRSWGRDTAQSESLGRRCCDIAQRLNDCAQYLPLFAFLLFLLLFWLLTTRWK